MNHNIMIDGCRFRLRPVKLSDASFMLSLRTDPDLSEFLNSTSNKLEDQQKYIKKYFETSNDYYFIIENMTSNTKEGMIALYDFDTYLKKAEWGRWIIRNGSMAALESAILIYEVGFNRLKLDMIYCRTLEENKSVVSFHESFGLKIHSLLENYTIINGKPYNAVEQQMEYNLWQEKRINLLSTAERLAKRYELS